LPSFKLAYVFLSVVHDAEKTFQQPIMENECSILVYFQHDIVLATVSLLCCGRQGRLMHQIASQDFIQDLLEPEVPSGVWHLH
jgi:hypothetical protein